MATLQFGTATREITPSYPVWMHGYSDRTRPSDSIAEPLSLGCLALRSGDKTLLLVTSDMIGIQAHVCDTLYDLLAREVGIRYPDVMLCSSHTHFAPALHAGEFRSPEIGHVEPDPRFVEDFQVKLVEAARESLRALRPGQLERVRLHVPQILYNRRTIRPDGSVQTNVLYPPNPDAYRFSPTDDQFTILRLTNESGVGAVLVNFGCHPVTGGQIRERDHYRVSSDYPFYLRQTIAARYRCPVFFTLGAAGDAVPINRYGDARQRIGGILGDSAILAERTYRPDQSALLASDLLTLDAETILTTDATAAASEHEQARAAALALGSDPATDRAGETYQAALHSFTKKQTAWRRSQLYPENRWTIRAQFLRIGESVWVGLPFEVLSEFSLRMKARYPESVLASCTGGYQGYLPLAYEYDRGGYEANPDSTHFAPGTTDRLLDAVLNKLATW